MNQTGSFIMRATNVSRTMLSKIVQMVAEAQHGRAPIQRLADQVAGWFVLRSWLLRSSPLRCGPSSRASACLCVGHDCCSLSPVPARLPRRCRYDRRRQSAQHGILIRNAEALETLEKIDTLVVDKTGTLTMGKPDLVAVDPVEGINETEFLAAVAGVEMGSEHPLAHAIVEGARARGVSPAEATDLASTTGEGVEANVQNRRIAIGNEKMMRRVGIDDDVWLGSAESGRSQGQTVMFVAFDGHPAGIAVADRSSRPARSHRRFARRDIRVVMLTGDGRATAERSRAKWVSTRYTPMSRPRTSTARLKG